MKIQVISHNKKIKCNGEYNFTYSSLGEPLSLDAFDINIISLQTSDLWKYRGASRNLINASSDFQSLKTLISCVKKSKVIVSFPQNYTYFYNYLGGEYQYSVQLKNIISDLKEILKFLIPQGVQYELIYENSTTLCNGEKYTAAFCFVNQLKKEQILTRCLGGDHTTTYYATSNLIFTSLDLSDTNFRINNFLKEIGMLEDKSETPEWVQNVKFFDDDIQNLIVVEANNEIQKQNEIIKFAQEKLRANLRYKSILFETGEELVKVVFEILEKILNYSLSDFVDEKKEDFRIALPDVTFIGEIKGITSNVKSENVSQLDVHCQSYSDYLQENDKTENIKGILIINPLRNKPISERDEVHENQIRIANRNGSLIVTTETLLHLFVAYLENKITNDGIIDLLKNKTGLLTVSDFTK